MVHLDEPRRDSLLNGEYTCTLLVAAVGGTAVVNSRSFSTHLLVAAVGRNSRPFSTRMHCLAGWLHGCPLVVLALHLDKPRHLDEPRRDSLLRVPVVVENVAGALARGRDNSFKPVDPADVALVASLRQ